MSTQIRQLAAIMPVLRSENERGLVRRSLCEGRLSPSSRQSLPPDKRVGVFQQKGIGFASWQFRYFTIQV